MNEHFRRGVEHLCGLHLCGGVPVIGVVFEEGCTGDGLGQLLLIDAAEVAWSHICQVAPTCIMLESFRLGCDFQHPRNVDLYFKAAC